MKKPVKPLAELLDSVRDIEGFPIGTDEDILALSDPPYYTACPNPYINDFIEEYGTPYDEETDDYHREPFVADVSEGKNDPIYTAHTYHTKVPYKAIIPYIQQFTEDGDIVFDGFCGTGMTGFAANASKRKAILSDLSPLATFLAHNYNSENDLFEFEAQATSFLNEVEKECGWMYETIHLPNEKKNSSNKGKIHYTVWSDVFICPYCNNSYVYWDVGIDKDAGKARKFYNCPNCNAEITKKNSLREKITFKDNAIGEEVTLSKQVPVLINYSYLGKRYNKVPDKDDLLLISKIQQKNIPFWYPTTKLPHGYNTDQPARSHGFTNVHLFYSKRNLWALAHFFSKISNSDEMLLKFLFTSIVNRSTQMNRIHLKNFFFGGGGWNAGYLKGTLYVPSLPIETSIFEQIRSRIKSIKRAFIGINFSCHKNVIVSSGSSTSVPIPDDTIDYIFTDPPFGANIMYSELNFIWESWLNVFTNNKEEAIINKTQNKGLNEYYKLMKYSFRECYRILKPNRWITVVFHNSKSAVWNSIQDAMIKEGFIIANVSILDKKQGSFKQVTSIGSVKNDLVISGYKPSSSFDSYFLAMAGEGLEEEFIKMHLAHLQAEPSVERTEQMLYSKLLAYYVQRSYTVKYDSSTFYKMLRDNFVEEDSYWFNQDQLDNYHEYKQKMKLEDIDEIKSGQMVLFIQDEKSAIIWLNSFLTEPKDFQKIHPAYTKIANIAGDNVPDIKELLDKNFILEKGKYRRPQSEDEKLSVNEKRERELQREFDALLMEAKGSRKKIKECRKQAVIYGFEQCYKNKKFKDILTLASRLNKKIIENDSEITEFIEVAEMKEEGF